MLDIHLQTSITMSQAHRQNSFGNTHNIIFNQRFESPFWTQISCGTMTRSTSSTNSTGWMCICRTCTNTQPFVQPKTYRIFVSFAVVKMNLSCARSTYLIKKKNDSCQTVSLRLYKISSGVGEKLVFYWMPASFFIYNSFTRRKSHTKVGRSRSPEIGA